jgi:protein-S-isoprenylcysteine O-methyltransferase Ste14
MTQGTMAPPQGRLFEAVIAYGNFIFRRRNIVFPIVMVALMAAFVPVMAYGDPAADRGLDLVGYLICTAGQAFRFAVVGLEYIKRGGLNKRIYAAKLVTGGLFAASRNPLYLGNVIILIGLMVIHNSPWVYGLCGGFFLLTYWALVLAEERYLRGQFGADYDAYCARVPRWLPKLAALPEALRGMRFNWRRAIAKEYSSCIAWVVSALIIDAYELVRVQGVTGNWSDLIELGIAFVVALVALAGIRMLKKRSVLRDA